MDGMVLGVCQTSKHICGDFKGMLVVMLCCFATTYGFHGSLTSYVNNLSLQYMASVVGADVELMRQWVQPSPGSYCLVCWATKV